MSTPAGSGGSASAARTSASVEAAGGRVEVAPTAPAGPAGCPGGRGIRCAPPRAAIGRAWHTRYGAAIRSPWAAFRAHNAIGQTTARFTTGGTT